MENLTSNNYQDYTNFIGSIPWIFIYCIIISAICLGNLLTIFAIMLSRQLSSTVSNQFIFSLAISDLLVGITIPYHMYFYLPNIYEIFEHERNTCVMRFVLISFACISSINNLFLIAGDRYLAIVYPLHYNIHMTKKISTILIFINWFLSLIISLLPVFWNLWKKDSICDINILPKEYFHFILSPIFIMICLTMIFVYMKIWREAIKHTKRMKNNTNINNNYETKSVQVVMLTLGCFSICWMPYFIVTTYFHINGLSNKFSLLYEIGFTMAVANSGMNPIIYAWKNSNFRMAFWCLLTCQSPNKTNKKNIYITNHIPSEKRKTIEHDNNIENKINYNGDSVQIKTNHIHNNDLTKNKNELNNTTNNLTKDYCIDINTYDNIICMSTDISNDNCNHNDDNNTVPNTKN